MSRARLLVLLTVALWTFGTLLGRVISHRAPFLLLSASFLASFVAFLPYAGRAGLRRAANARHLLFGASGYFLYSTALMLSFRAYGRASEPTVLNYTWPVFTLLLTPRFAASAGLAVRSSTARARIGVALCLLSVATLATGLDPRSFDAGNLPGLLYGLAAGLSYGLFSAYSSTVPSDDHAGFLLAASGGSVVAMAPLALRDLPEAVAVTPAEWAAAFALGALVNGLGYATWTLANRLAAETGEPLARVTAPVFLLPLLSLCAIALLLGEGRLFDPAVALAALLVTAGAALCRDG